MNLSQVLRKWRFAIELDPKAAADVIGIDTKSYRRIEEKGLLDSADVGRVIAWLFGNGPAAKAPNGQQVPVAGQLALESNGAAAREGEEANG